MTADLFERALAFRDAGLSVIPIRYRDKRPDGQALKWVGAVDADGWPTWNPYKGRQATVEELRVWFQLSGRRNIGIVTGYNGLVVIDFDSFDAWDAWQSLAAALGMAALCAATNYRVWTSRGIHLYLQAQEPVTSYSIGLIDVKAQWGYVLGEASVHPNGWIYRGNGGDIPTVNSLAEVFPFAPRPVSQPAAQAPAAVYGDPWDAVDNATIGAPAGSIDAIKARMTPAMLLGLPEPTARTMIRCPLHADSNPSFVLYPGGRWKCWGCLAHGDVLDLYAALYGMSNRQAIVALSEQVI